jgi:hypothetical protein
MVQFVEAFPDREIVAALLRQLAWTHFTMLIPLEDKLKRDFYFEMCRIEGWSVRDLRERIQSMLFERTVLSKKPEALIKKELSTLRESRELTPDLVMRDPYMLNFLGLADSYSEKDLEAANQSGETVEALVTTRDGGQDARSGDGTTATPHKTGLASLTHRTVNAGPSREWNQHARNATRSHRHRL